MGAPTPEDSPARQVAASRFRLRLVAGCAVLLGIAFIQAPGLLVGDTKFDLVADPAGFLSRAAHLWDAQGALGQLQNQAYGYFWPMGTFFVLGDALGLDGWVVQRLWMALVMCVAFVGAGLLARALGVWSDAAALLAAFAFATSPRILSTIGPISIEAWPSAVAPWVLLALVIGAERGSPRRAAALAGLGVAMVGGVNAAATFAVIPLGVVWLLTRQSGPRRTSMILWWPVFTLLGTLWWLVPLFVMGAYSPPFLDFIESASVTTFPTTLFDALRGTSAWVPYVDSSWQGGNQTITQGYLALNSGLVLMLGLAGIAGRRNPHAQFLFLSVLLGLFMVTLGHEGAVQGWFASALQGSLDGVLAPIRNVHKFDPVVRLPMVLGLAFLLDRVSAESVRSRVDEGLPWLSWSTRTPVLLLATVAVVGAAMPALGARLAPTRGVVETPDYWVQTATWLDKQPGHGVALLAPGSSFGDYLWGSPKDEPMQYLSDSRWAVRNAVPLTNPGNIRMLDAIENRFVEGHGSRGLAPYLRRSGIEYVVVRNDLRPSGDVPDPVLVRRTLQTSTGLDLVASFGPRVGGDPWFQEDGRRVVVDRGWQADRAAIEIYRVDGGGEVAAATDAPPTVVGGPEDLLDLLDTGLIGDAPTVLAADRAGLDPVPGPVEDGAVLLTDGMLDRERFFGRVHDGSSAVRSPGDSRRSGNPVVDYELPEGQRWRSTVRLGGARAVVASTSMSDSDAFGGSRRGESPWAAVDDDAESLWRAGWSQGEADWWQVDFDSPTVPGEVTVALGKRVPTGTELEVVTDRGATAVRAPASGVFTVRVDEEVDWLRVSEAGTGGESLEIRDVHWEGRDLHRRIVTPAIPEGWGNPQAILLRSLGDRRTGCIEIGNRTPCTADKVVAPEEVADLDRVVTLPQAGTFDATLTAIPRGGRALETLIQSGSVVSATGSTGGESDPRASGIAALDGDPGTSWSASRDDPQPTLSVNLARPRTMSEVTLAVADAAPVRRPTRVTLSWPGGERELDLDPTDGTARFPEITTDQVQVTVLETEDAVTVDEAGNGADLPVGITELRFDGVNPGATRPSEREREFACGTGPTTRVNGRAVRSRVVASPMDLYSMTSVPVRPCGVGAGDTLSLEAGENLVDVAGSEALRPDALVLRAPGAVEAVPAAPVSATLGDTTRATFRLDNGPQVLAWRQNHNAGWEATRGGESAASVVVDGWQQGWAVDGTGPVTAEFTPDRSYRWGMALGALALLALVVLLAAWSRKNAIRPDAVRAAIVPPAATLGVALVGAGLLGGWLGLLVAAAGAAAAAAGHRRRDSASWMVGGLLAVAAVGYFVRPWGSSAGWAGDLAWPSQLVLLALGAAAGLLAVDALGDGGRRRFFNRMKGFSTRR